MKLSYVRQHFFDLRLPVVAPSRVLWVWWKNMAGKAERRWPAFVSRCECEMRRAATRQTMATIAALAAKPYFAGLLL